jgi:predicted RND superfamily exporter protein
MDHNWTLFGGWVIRRYRLVLTACLVLMALVAYGLMHTTTSIDLLKLFHPKARILHDYVWLEERLGRLIPMEIVLRFNPQTQADANKVDPTDPQRFYKMSFLERMETVSLTQEVIERQFGVNAADVVGRSMSAATFAPPVDSASTSTLSFARRSGLNKRLEQSRDQFKTSGYFGIDPVDHAELWRVSLRVAAFENVDYGAFVRELQQTVEPVLAAHHARGQVLGEIVGKRQSDRYAGASVFIWNRSGQPVLGEEPVKSRQREEQKREQTIFADTLKTLLTKARLRVAVNDTDPATIPVTYLERLQTYDCVVLVGEFSDADVEMIRDHSGRVVDTRTTLATQIAAAADSNRKILTPGPAGIAAVYTGVVPIVYKAQRALLDSLIQSSFWSFITITPLMMFVSRSISAGAIAMLPNILPILVIFGGMGWFGFPVDIGSMMAASIALGVAVDDTIHFMTWFRDDLDRTHDRNAALLTAYRRCATPTTQAALVNGLGLSVFATSTFMPTLKFGWLMLVILFAGLIAELVLTPALIASPLGRFFKPRKRKVSPGDAATGESEVAAAETLEEVTAVAGVPVAASDPPRSHIDTVCRALSAAAKERRAAG